MRTAAAIVALALGLGGCGAGAREPERAAAPAPPKGDWGPSRPGSGERARPAAPPRRTPRASVASALEDGEVGVVGVEGAVGIRPAALEVSADGTLEDLRWERWGSRGAEGSGTLKVRDCDPTCASGGIDSHPATVRLSAPRLCGRATYFDRARLEVDGAPEAASYVRAPC